MTSAPRTSTSCRRTVAMWRTTRSAPVSSTAPSWRTAPASMTVTMDTRRASHASSSSWIGYERGKALKKRDGVARRPGVTEKIKMVRNEGTDYSSRCQNDIILLQLISRVLWVLQCLTMYVSPLVSPTNAVDFTLGQWCCCSPKDVHLQVWALEICCDCTFYY